MTKGHVRPPQAHLLFSVVNKHHEATITDDTTIVRPTAEAVTRRVNTAATDSVRTALAADEKIAAAAALPAAHATTETANAMAPVTVVTTPNGR